MQMQERSWSGEGYRFGFNGHEKTDEISGTGNHNTAMFWEYDTRLGRRWNLDPYSQIFVSDYAAFGNNPILFTDPLGDLVGYSGFRDRVNTGIGWIFSKGFRKEFNLLKDDTKNTWIFTRNSNKSENLGFISQGKNEHEFLINYSTKSNDRAIKGLEPNGESSLTTMFEETRHATNFLTGQTAGVYEINTNSRLTNFNSLPDEVDAHKFAAQNDPFIRNSMNLVNYQGYDRVLFKTTIQSSIRKADDATIETILYDGWILFAGASNSSTTKISGTTTANFAVTYKVPPSYKRPTN